MSKFLSLCNQLLSINSTCQLPIPAGGECSDKYMRIAGILAKASLTNDEILYGLAVVGDAFNFEVRLQRRARVILALSFTLSEDKLAAYSARIAELVILYIRGQTKGRSDEALASYVGFKPWSWHKRYKAIYTELCDWCNELESYANIKVWNVLEEEGKSTV